MEIRVSIYDAKTQLSALVDRAIAGDEVIITRRGKAVAELRPVETKQTIRFGVRKGVWPDWDTEADNEEIRKLFDPELF
jgi:prevent-host-death family protein